MTAWLSIVGACQLACAADNAPFAAATAPVLPGPVGGTLRVALSMILVLGALLATAWIARRMRGASGSPSGGLEVLSQVSLGARERAVLIRVGERQLLVGVAPGSVRTLHVLRAGSNTPACAAASDGALPSAGPSPPSFKALLLKSLGK